MGMYYFNKKERNQIGVKTLQHQRMGYILHLKE
jgi:hypothetical protein